MNKLKWKAVLSTTMLIVFSIVAITGILMFIHGGRIVGKIKWIHTFFGITLIGLVALHFYLNSKVWKSEITSKP